MVGHFTKHLLQKNSSVSLAFPNKQVQSSIHFSASNPLTIVDSMGFCPWAPALGGKFYTPNFPLFFSFWRAERSDRWASCMASWRFCLEHCKCPFVCFSSWHLEVTFGTNQKFWPQQNWWPSMGGRRRWSVFFNVFFFAGQKKWFCPRVEWEVVSNSRDFFPQPKNYRFGYRMIFGEWANVPPMGGSNSPFPKLVASLFHHFRRLVMNIRAQVIVLIEITMNGIDGGVGVDPY